MICKLKHTGKVSTEATPEAEKELLGYNRIEVQSILEFRFDQSGRFGLSVGLIMNCINIDQKGSATTARHHWGDIELDIRNGYLVPE